MTIGTFQKTLLATAVLGLAAAAQAQAPAGPVKFNGDANMEFDTTYRNNNRGWDQGGRVEMNVAGRSTASDAFVAARASFLAKKTGEAVVDDMWVQFGTSAGDLKLGRFEAADLYPVGRDTVLDRAGQGAYRGNFMRGRNGNGIVHIAGNVNFGGGLGLEVGLVETKDAANLADIADTGQIFGSNAKGVRPVLYYSGGAFNFKAGVEYGKANVGGAFEDFQGVALTGGAKVMGGDLNVNFAAGDVDNTIKGWTVGANVTVPLGPWLLLEYAENELDEDILPDAKEKVWTAAVGYQFPLLGIKDATIIPAFSYSKVKDALDPAADDTQQAFRVRIFYTFNAF